MSGQMEASTDQIAEVLSKQPYVSFTKTDDVSIFYAVVVWKFYKYKSTTQLQDLHSALD